MSRLSTMLRHIQGFNQFADLLFIQTGLVWMT